MTFDSILKYKNNEQKNFFERNKNIKKEVRGEKFENGMQGSTNAFSSATCFLFKNPN